MEILNTVYTTHVFGAPKDWDPGTGQCVGLPLHLDPNGPVMHSFWRPTELDIANILAGLPVRLSVFGSGHPPVMLTVTGGVE